MLEAINTANEARRLAVRAELNKLRPDFISQADWDEQMDEDDQEDASELAVMIKSANKYDAEHPEETSESASPGDCAVVPMEDFLAANGLPPLSPVIPVEP